MRIYYIIPHDSVQRLDMDVDQRTNVIRTLGRGTRWQGDWRAPAVWRLQKPRKRKPEMLCDWTVVGASVGVPALSTRAKRILEPVLGSHAQWLPLVFDEAEYWLLNLLHVIDALDAGKSEIRTLPNGSVMNIETYAFKPDAVADEWLFKVTQHPHHVLATDRFRALIEAEALTGMFFQPMWDSEHAPFRPTPGRAEMLTRPEIYGPEGFVTNVKEHWPPGWKEQERRMKLKTGS